MQKTTDMTKGRPLSLIGLFALPLLVGNIFQMLYSVADGAVVGRLLGVGSFAAVGAAAFYTWLITDIILGFTQGFGVLLAQRFGGKDEAGLRKAVAMSILLCLGLAALLVLVGQLAAAPVLRMIDTPWKLTEEALLYLRCILAGIPAAMAYNLSASLLRALGNSKAPVIAVVIANLCNVGMNLLFSAVFHWGVAGVAFATVASQVVAFAYCLRSLRSLSCLRLSTEDFRWSGADVKELLRLGLPPALRNGVISFGGLLIQKQINLYGTLFVAGTTAAQKYFDLMNLAGGALEGAVATYSAQNFGARDMTRLKKGIRATAVAALVCSAVTAGAVILLRRFLIGLLISGAPEELAEILRFGGNSLLAMALFLPMLYLLCIYRAGLQGMGNTVYPTLSGFVELLLRLAAVTLLSEHLGKWAVYLASPIGWLGAFLLLFLAYHGVYRKNCRTQEN